MLPLIPLAVVAIGGGAWFLSKKPVVKATAAQQVIFQQALATERDPVKLRALAKQFADVGLTTESDILIRRAKLRELPPEIKAGRRAAFKKAITSTDKAAVMTMASLHEREGADGAATALREYAKGLK